MNVLPHPNAVRSSRPPETPEDAADSGLPEWIYGLFIFTIPVTLLLSGPFEILTAGLLWIVYLTYVAVSPERAIFAFAMTFGMIRANSMRAFPLLRGMNAATVLTVTLAYCAWVSRSRQPQPTVRNVYFRPVLVFSLILTISAILSWGVGSAQVHSFARGWQPWPAASLFSALKSDIFVAALAPIAFRLIWNRAQLQAAVVTIAIYSALVSAQGLWERAHMTFAPGERVPSVIRAMGAVFREPNTFGGFLALMTIILTPVVLSGKLPFRLRLIVAGGLGISLVGLLFSFSRGAWVATLGGFAMLSLLRGAKGLVVMIVLAMTATAWMPQAVLDRYEYTVRDRQTSTGETTDFDNSTETRLRRWRAVPGIFFASPVYGHGYRSFGAQYGVINDSGRNTGPHSCITEFMVEQGMIGMISYLWIVWIVFWTSYQLRRITDDPFLVAIATGVAAATPALGLLDLSGRRFLSGGLMVAWWLLAAGTTRQWANLRGERMEA